MTYDVWKSKYINIPGFQLDVGGLLQIYVQPCTTSPYIIARTLIPSALKAFISFEIPDPKEAFRIQTRKLQKGGISLLKSVKGFVAEARELALDAYQPLDEELARRARNFAETEAAAEKYIWDLLEFGERAVFWLFIASIIEEMFIDWSSQVWKQSGCVGDPFTFWEHAGTDIQGGAAATDQWFGCTAWKDCPSSNGIITEQGFSFVVPAGQSWSFTSFHQMFQFNGDPQPAQFRLYDITADEELAFSSGVSDLFDTQQFGILDTRKANRDSVSHTLQVQAKLEPPIPTFPVNTANSKFHFSRTSHPQDPVQIESAAFNAFASVFAHAALPPVKGTPLDWLDNVLDEIPRWLYGND